MEEREIQKTNDRQIEPARQVDALDLIEKWQTAIKRLLHYAVSATHSGQWVNMGGKPFPTAPAAEVMARRCRLKVGSPVYVLEKLEDEKGHYYMYSCELTASLPGSIDELTATGTCNSRDQFFSRKHGADVPQSEIDPGNIKKSAYSNALMNAVTKLLGVRNLSWQQLAECGIKRSDMASVEFDGKDGERKAATEAQTRTEKRESQPQTTPPANSKKITEAQGKYYHVALKKAGLKADDVKATLTATYGIENIADLPIAQFNDALKWIEAGCPMPTNPAPITPASETATKQSIKPDGLLIEIAACKTQGELKLWQQTAKTTGLAQEDVGRVADAWAKRFQEVLE